MRHVKETLYEFDIHQLKKHTYLCDIKDLPKNIKERTAIEYGKKPKEKEEEEINKTKEFYTSLPDGTQVFYVDIKPIRNIVYKDFVEGGNEMAYPNFIPIGEIWIDNIFKASKNRTEQILVHEAIERKKMQADSNRPYYKKTAKTRMNKTGEQGAHIDANNMEKKVRDGKISVKEAIDKFYGKK